MGVSTVVRLPLLTAQSLAPTYQRLQHYCSARITRRWFLEIRSFHQAALHADSGFVARDRLEQHGASQQNGNQATGPAVSIEEAEKKVTARMWHLTSSQFPGLVFVYVELVPVKSSEAKANNKMKRSLFVASASLAQLMAKGNLPRPLGAAEGTTTLGPGSWTQKGNTVSIEGVMLDLPDQVMGAYTGVNLGGAASDLAPRTMLNGTGPSAAKPNQDCEWSLGLGQVSVGGGRAAGAIAELEYLPLDEFPNPAAAVAPVSLAHALFADQAGLLSGGTSGVYIHPPPSASLARDLELGDLTSPNAGEMLKTETDVAVERMRSTAFMYIQTLRAEGIL